MLIRPDENTARARRADTLQWMQQSIRREVDEFGPLVPKCLVDILAMTADNATDTEVERARMDHIRLIGNAKLRAAKIEADASGANRKKEPHHEQGHLNHRCGIGLFREAR